MPSSHLILCRPLLLLSPMPPSIRVFSNESTLHEVAKVLECQLYFFFFFFFFLSLIPPSFSLFSIGPPLLLVAQVLECLLYFFFFFLFFQFYFIFKLYI